MPRRSVREERKAEAYRALCTRYDAVCSTSVPPRIVSVASQWILFPWVSI